MPDLNKEALEIWNALKPMIDKEIDKRTQGMVQRRKAKVTTAPSLETNTIGITEPFGNEMFVPFTSKLISATVGDFVWVEFSYGATNAVASGFATLDEKDLDVAGDLTVHGGANVSGSSTFNGNATFNGNVSGITASEVGAVPQSGADGFLVRSSNSVSQKELYKTLWSGSWSSGNITVDDLSSYHLFEVSFTGQATRVLAISNGSYLRGVGGYATGASAEAIFYLSATQSNDTLTMVYARYVTSAGARSALTVSEIIGII